MKSPKLLLDSKSAHATMVESSKKKIYLCILHEVCMYIRKISSIGTMKFWLSYLCMHAQRALLFSYLFAHTILASYLKLKRMEKRFYFSFFFFLFNTNQSGSLFFTSHRFFFLCPTIAIGCCFCSCLGGKHQSEHKICE